MGKKFNKLLKDNSKSKPMPWWMFKQSETDFHDVIVN